MSRRIKIAILSDLHACADRKDSKKPSWLAMDEDPSNTRVHPISSLKKIIRDEKLSADMLFCGGDLGDKAEPKTQVYAWNEVQKIKSELNASCVLGAVGNHDVDSRFGYTSYDAKGQVQALEPKFPVDIEKNWLEHWAKHYTILELFDIRIVLLNSSAYHGYAKDASQPEYQNGRISDRTLESLAEQLRILGRRATNVLFCHHHPTKNDAIPLEDYSQMENGDRLINLLGRHDYGPWLVIHGHKHFPRIFYGSGSSSAPVIFSSGSFSARLYPEIASLARNEFYILELEVPDPASGASSVRGVLNVWQWYYGEGWLRSKGDSGLSSKTGFGARVDVAELAAEIANHPEVMSGRVPVRWTNLCRTFSKLEYLIPDDLEHLVTSLETVHGLLALRDDKGTIVEVQAKHG